MGKRSFLDLIISFLPGLAPSEKITLLNAVETEEELFIKTQRQIEELLCRHIKNYWDINDIRDKADRIDTFCGLRSIKWVSWTNDNFPPLLREIYDSPAVLYYKGNLPNPEKPLLGMVGTRKPSPEAASQAYRIACGAGKAGISVISGLAFGIDAMSHRGNLLGDVPGYAVLGSGIDDIYPSANRPLAKQILDSGGALLSEYPPGVHPTKWSFPARNRIISALSRSVIIVEAPERSGSLITASFALDQGKDLWVASVGTKTANMLFDRRGTIKLAEDGAEIINSENDVLEKWNIKKESLRTTSSMALNVLQGKNGRRDAISSMADFLKIEI